MIVVALIVGEYAVDYLPLIVRKVEAREAVEGEEREANNEERSLRGGKRRAGRRAKRQAKGC